LARKLGDFAQSERVDGGRRHSAGERGTHFLLDAGSEHRAGALLDPPLERLLWYVESEHDRRVPCLAGPEAVLLGPQRPPQLRQLECADDAAAVVGMQA